jgi:RNA polymerase sigma factor for flagellar operon FliA
MFEPARDSHVLPHDLALRMIPTVHRIARQLARRLPRHIHIDDVIGAGCQGLVAAYTRFDPARAEGFEAFAEFRIRGAMLDELRASDPLSRDQRAHANRVAAATRALHARLGRQPAADEVAAELGVSLESYWEQQAAAATAVTSSLDGDDVFDAGAHVQDPRAEPADEQFCRKEAREAINRAIADLPPRLQRVLELYYAEGLTLRQIGEMMGVSESRICQLQTEAVRRIREACLPHASDAAPASGPRVRRAHAPRALKAA